MLFSERSVLTMVHGAVLGGGALMALAAALFAMGVLLRPAPGSAPVREDRTRAPGALLVVIAAPRCVISAACQPELTNRWNAKSDGFGVAWLANRSSRIC